jgi:hypothetical protein
VEDLEVEEPEDGGEDAGEAVAGVGEQADAGRDLADDDRDGGNDVELGDDGQAELDDRGGDVEDQAQAGVELDANDSEDLWRAWSARGSSLSWEKRQTYRP